VSALPVTEFSDSKSLLRPIARAFTKKSAPITKAKAMKYVTMLAIDVERADAHAYVDAGLKVRGFPAELDHVWLLMRRPGVDGVESAFHASRAKPQLVRLDTD
jgi:hypothetical protein